MRAEFRRDFSDRRFFVKRAGELVDAQNTFTVGFVYVFSSRTP